MNKVHSLVQSMIDQSYNILVCGPCKMTNSKVLREIIQEVDAKKRKFIISKPFECEVTQNEFLEHHKYSLIDPVLKQIDIYSEMIARAEKFEPEIFIPFSIEYLIDKNDIKKIFIDKHFGGCITSLQANDISHLQRKLNSILLTLGLSEREINHVLSSIDVIVLTDEESKKVSEILVVKEK